VKVVFSTDKTDLAWLKQVPGVTAVKVDRGKVEVQGTGPVLALTASALVAHGIVPPDLAIEQPTLEDVFLKLTGHATEE
jgi:ABC-2 type transport system ATP-binding protein